MGEKLMNHGIRLLLLAFSLVMPLTLMAMESDGSLNRYKVINLVANDPSYDANNIDPDLLNPWGLVFNDHGDLIVADNGSDFLATSYEPNGAKRGFRIPGEGDDPTGLVRNRNEHAFKFGSNP